MLEHRIHSAAGDSARAEGALVLAEIAALAEAASDLAGAERALAAAVAWRPDFADLQLRHGRVLGRLGRGSDARAAFERAMTHQPRFAEARLDLAMLDAREGRVGEALAALHALARDRPAPETQAFDQGMKQLERANWEAAGSLLRRGLGLEAPGFHEFLALARRHLEERRAPEAVALLRTLIAEHPAYPDLHALLGTAELLRGHTDDAVSSLARALELHPDFLEARALFAQALETLGAFAAAAEQAALVLEREPGHHAALAIDRRWARHRDRPRPLTAS